VAQAVEWKKNPKGVKICYIVIKLQRKGDMKIGVQMGKDQGKVYSVLKESLFINFSEAGWWVLSCHGTCV
jgi:hypothetical protein